MVVVRDDALKVGERQDVLLVLHYSRFDTTGMVLFVDSLVVG